MRFLRMIWSQYWGWFHKKTKQTKKHQSIFSIWKTGQSSLPPHIRLLTICAEETSFEQSVLIPQRTFEGRCCLLSPSQLLALTTGKAGSGRALLWAAPKKYSEGRGAEGVRQLDRKTDPDRWDRGKEPPSNFAAAKFVRLFLFLFTPFSLVTRTDPAALQTKKMPKSSPCVFPWSSVWLASLATLVVQSVLSSSYSSSSSPYQGSAAGGKRPGFMERTLVLLDVNTRSPIRVLNDNFLSLQLDPSIIKDGWLDFLRYQRTS